jgi:hypothetical protein
MPLKPHEFAPEPPAIGSRLPPGMLRQIKAQPLTVDSASLLKDLIEEWGGTKKLAHDIRREFARAPRGGQIRQRILEMIQRLVINVTNDDLAKPLDPTAMDDSILEELAMSYFERTHKAAMAEEGIPVKEELEEAIAPSREFTDEISEEEIAEMQREAMKLFASLGGKIDE